MRAQVCMSVTMVSRLRGVAHCVQGLADIEKLPMPWSHLYLHYLLLLCPYLCHFPVTSSLFLLPSVTLWLLPMPREEQGYEPRYTPAHPYQWLATLKSLLNSLKMCSLRRTISVNVRSVGCWYVRVNWSFTLLQSSLANVVVLFVANVIFITYRSHQLQSARQVHVLMHLV